MPMELSDFLTLDYRDTIGASQVVDHTLASVVAFNGEPTSTLKTQLAIIALDKLSLAASYYLELNRIELQNYFIEIITAITSKTKSLALYGSVSDRDKLITTINDFSIRLLSRTGSICNEIIDVSRNQSELSEFKFIFDPLPNEKQQQPHLCKRQLK